MSKFPPCPKCGSAHRGQCFADGELAAAPGSAQDQLDWRVFSELHIKERGYAPRICDRQHRELYHWFTLGAHSEMMGRLTPNPNSNSPERNS